MRTLDLLFFAALMIGGTLWLAAAISGPDQHPSQVARPYVGPDLGGIVTTPLTRIG